MFADGIGYVRMTKILREKGALNPQAYPATSSKKAAFLMGMLVFALRVLNGEIEDNDDTTYWTFWQIYYFVEPHIRDEYLQREGTST
jgi:hypothetical protein